jgi:hypothetical protein
VRRSILFVFGTLLAFPLYGPAGSSEIAETMVVVGDSAIVYGCQPLVTAWQGAHKEPLHKRRCLLRRTKLRRKEEEGRGKGGLKYTRGHVTFA